MDNYIVINGKKAELTEEQLKALGIEIKKKRNNPFNSELKDGDIYYYNTYSGITDKHYMEDARDHINMSHANSFNDRGFANQVYLHELLNRKLLKYAWDNEWEDKQKWNGAIKHYYIVRNELNKNLEVTFSYHKALNTVYFPSICTAKKAIEEVIKPFMEKHKDFVW